MQGQRREEHGGAAATHPPIGFRLCCCQSSGHPEALQERERSAMAERRRRGKEGSPQPPLVSEEEEPVMYGTPLEESTTAFARRNPLLVRCPSPPPLVRCSLPPDGPLPLSTFHCRQPCGSESPPPPSAHFFEHPSVPSRPAPPRNPLDMALRHPRHCNSISVTPPRLAAPQAAFIPDFMEDAVDALLPDAFEAKMERSAQRVARERTCCYLSS